MIPGSPFFVEMQQLALANDSKSRKDDVFIRQAVAIGLSLDIPVSEIFLEQLGHKTHVLDIRTVAEYVFAAYPERFLAGFDALPKVAFRQVLLKFWEAYSKYYPHHPVFSDHGHRLSSCVPVKIHSDEGTGLRRTGVYQFSWGPVLPSDLSSVSRYIFWSCMKHEDYKDGHAGYERGNHILDELCGHFAAQALDVYLNGVQTEVLGKVFLVWVAHEGDLPAQAKAYHCKRNFNCTPNSMCSWCLANDTTLPYTDVRDEAQWRRTVYVERPWTTPGPFQQIPGADHEMFLAKDLFHLCHLGAIRTFCINLMCFLVTMKADDASIPLRLQVTYRLFKQYCTRRREYPRVKHFTKENLSWTSMSKYPEASFKGSDAPLLLGFLIDYMARPEVELDEIGKTGYVAAKAIDDFLRSVFSTKSQFLSKSEGIVAATALSVWLQKTYECAKMCFDKRITFFNLTPKMHYLGHVLEDMRAQLSLSADADDILNPTLFATQAAEDWVGKACQIARTVHPRTVAKRSAQKYLIAAKLFWDKARE
ncbi:unnamed protein product [Durusdinium trenchii]|uniref:Uncharacterized protein n=1 Tax=Durusdinium trenchii TaxID=1381693 RepID=A0ABP0S1S3_9DINO